MTNGTPTTKRKAGEAGVGLTLATAVGFFLAWINPDVPPESVAFLAGLAGVLVTSGASFMRRYAVAYDSKFLKVLLGIGLVLVFAGCGTVGTPWGGVKTSGDTNQDVVQIEGACTISQGVNAEGVDGWTVTCEEGGVASWVWAESSNADLYVDLVRAGIEGVVAGMSPAP